MDIKRPTWCEEATEMMLQIMSSCWHSGCAGVSSPGTRQRFALSLMKEPYAAVAHAHPVLFSSSSLPELLALRCWESLELVMWINFQMQIMAGSGNSWLGAAQDAPLHSSFPMPLPLSSSATSEDRGASEEGTVDVGSLCCTDLVILPYSSRIITSFSPPKKPKTGIWELLFLKKTILQVNE